MISIEDCIALSGLTRDEVDAIGEHAHMPAAAATALASYLLNRPEGAREIREMIVEDIREARAKGDHKHAAELFGALRHFLQTH